MKPGTAASHRTRSNVRRAHNRRALRLTAIALVVALLACSGIYRTVMAPAIQAALDPTGQPPENTPTTAPTDEITPQPTDIPLVTETPYPELPPILTTPLPTLEGASIPYFYYAQAGDTLPAVAIRFGVSPTDITSPDPLPDDGLINPNQLLNIPRRLVDTSAATRVMPDSEVIYSPSAIDFDTLAYINKNNGFLKTFSEYLGSTGNTSGPEILQRVALDYSINPRLLLALLEYQSHWVLGQPPNEGAKNYPMGLADSQQKLFEQQLSWAANTLAQGYYGWREGRLIELTFPDKTTLRLAPDLNAGSVALLYFFAQIDNFPQWTADIYAPDKSMPVLEEKMFGSPWLRAEAVEPLFPNALAQPEMSLPFAPGSLWSFTQGPHPAWGLSGPHAALDFAPSSTEHGCVASNAWVLAIATGVVVRSEIAEVIVDLDGDGHESTGWDILYQHISAASRIPVGTRVSVGDKIGHPSCEGGPATGTHTHIARKYNGEWIEAGGPLPFVMSGWEAHLGDKPLEGTLTRGDQTVSASPISVPYSYIYGDVNNP